MSTMPAEADSPPPPVILRWSGITHRGKVRPNNEDSFLALAFDGHEVRYLGKTGEASLTGADFVFAVSDGMGGAKSGEFASRITVEKTSHLLPRAFRLTALGMKTPFADVLSELFGTIHQSLISLGASYEECSGMGTTLSLCWVTPGWIYFGHIGDSRIYRLSHTGELKQLTQDHSHVGWLRRNGRLNEREARTHPMRNALNQALGAGHQFVDPQIGAVDYAPGDRFLICSDGLTDGLWDRHLQEMLAGPLPPGRTLAQHLVDESLERSGRDNTTAVVVEIIAGEPAPATVAAG
ncbi:protein phosphatase 2C domain-containing protein [Horticoccus luteus]|uniref:Protein phosphatase 2C domain-containing protein n=1 Tax=Horticoccus luteus TaxID=2862869 RepID=A0A8F9XM48_9BACT|nr:protein phosphatase 2C domain-containing protein [Horticoccus luteus]QYM79886.1 protein phosphatase 2C domain-containing protein [Horticoccus luteus]